MTLKRLPTLFLILFVLSGIAGLVHETVWARYLGIILGHSAYGQILTLVVYMGGIGLGSALAGRLIHRFKNPLMAYVLVELGIGIGGFVFHHEFLLLRGWLLDSGILVGTSELTATLASVGVGVALTLPFALMIGMTYPLATAFFIRLQKDGGEDSVARLYFGNSLGAAFGAVLNSYFLIPQLGTAGALMVAGILNTSIAGLAWLAHRRSGKPATDTVAAPSSTISQPPLPSGAPRLLLASALVTGLSSFFYEIGWIRYLALLLGSSTHAFDLMVSAFILGLTGGAWTVHKKPHWNLSKTLIVAQICMAGTAVVGVVAYEPIFRAANELNVWFSRTAQMYPYYTAVRYLICLVVMLPASWFAGMTLPLICRLLLLSGRDESTTGTVYAWNTFGAIFGATIAGLALMPLIGPFRLVGLGAAIDLVLAVLLLYALLPERPRSLTFLGVASLILVSLSLVQEQKVHIIGAGVFRDHSKFREPQFDRMIHGRTASIRVLKQNNLVVLSTNGKSDASLLLPPDQYGPTDAMTQLMLGWIGRAYVSGPYRSAMIGMGSGQTANTVLQDMRCKSLDMIEIEPAVHELARWFSPLNNLAYSDPRIKMHFQDARIFFARQEEPYDLIVSEPSNPWVSGVSSLFTDEFYSEIKSRMSKAGILVQWFHIYGTNDNVALSVLKSVRKNFDHVMVLALPNPVDFYIVASPSPFKTNPSLEGTIDSGYLDANFMSRADFSGALEVLHNDAIDLATTAVPINSEFTPFVDHESEHAFFLHEQSRFLSQMEAGSISLDAISRNPVPLDIFPGRGRRSLLARSIGLQAKFERLEILLSRKDSLTAEDKSAILRVFRNDIPAWTWAIPRVHSAVDTFRRTLDSTRDSSSEASLFRWMWYTNKYQHDSASIHFARGFADLPRDLSAESIRDIYAYLVVSGNHSQAKFLRESILRLDPKIEERTDFALLGRLLEQRTVKAAAGPH